MKGGMFTHKGDFSGNLIQFIRGSTITPLGVNGSRSGIIFLITNVTPDPDHTNITIMPGKNPPLSNTTSLILKVGIISDVEVQAPIQDAMGHIIPGMRDKESISKAEFTDEVEMHTRIYNGSITVEFNPICPMLVFTRHYVQRNTDGLIIKALRDISHEIMRINNAYSIGVMIMENINGNVVNHYVQHTHPFSFSNISDIEKKESKLMANYAFALLRLRALGIQHGDTHFGNALVYEDYNFYGRYNIVLIDFGRSTTLTFGESSNPNHRPDTRGRALGYEVYRGINKFFDDLMATGVMLKNVFNEPVRCIGLDQFIAVMNNYRVNCTIDFLNNMLDQERTLMLTQILDKNIGRFENLYSMLSYSAGMPLNGVNALINAEIKKRAFDYAIPSIPSSTTNGGARNMGPIDLNIQSNCCFDTDLVRNPKKFFYNYLTSGNTYTWADALVFVTQKTPSIIYCYEGTNITRAVDGIYLWIIGSSADNILKLYAIHCNPAEIGTKHAHLIAYAPIENYRLAGQFKKTGNTILFNFCSETYMHGRFIELGITDVASQNRIFETSAPIAKLFIARELFLRGGPHMTVNYDPTSIVLGRIIPNYISPLDMCKHMHMLADFQLQDLPGRGKFVLGGFPSLDLCTSVVTKQGLIGQTGGNLSENYDLSLSKYETFTSQIGYNECIGISPKVLKYITENKLKLDKLIHALKGLESVSICMSREICNINKYGIDKQLVINFNIPIVSVKTQPKIKINIPIVSVKTQPKLKFNPLEIHPIRQDSLIGASKTRKKRKKYTRITYKHKLY